MRKLEKIIFKLFKLPKIKLEEVFTPATAAEVNYVERKDIDAQLLSEMKTPGKQIIVFGHSGSGKTSSVRNLLNKNKFTCIRTHCESNTTFEQLIRNAFDELNVYVVSGRTHKQSSSLKGNIATEYNSIKASLSSESTSEIGETYSRLLPPQLTPQKLAKFLGEYKIVWLIEDFHKVPLDEKVRIADAIKIFVDNANDCPSSKIICIGACQSAHELIQLDPNLQARVSEISVPLLTDEEIEKIIRNGFSLLNIAPSQSLVEKLVFYSDRLGASAHQMCMDICKGKHIYKTKFRKQQIDDRSFQFAVDGFIKRSSDTLKTIYESAIKNELGWYILKTLTINVKDKLSFEEICKRVNNGKATFKEDEIKAKLNELQSPAFDIIYYNPRSEKYAFSTPFWHRFLRLQFSIEKADMARKNKNKRNPNLKLISDDTIYQIVDKSMLELIKALHKTDYVFE
ncbi:AAA family ATPase [uncultured Rikenella sp.]|uniref:AAA family ATPase n=1 Tax=uncultured Rikenella sp. TaxID=368003 RepID=UPI00262B3237|nr:AAA family ATPase [uncultured Rikenella sp.]